MKTTRLLSTVAATVLLTAGIASAQMPKGDESPGRPPAAQQKAPAEKSAPAIRGGEQKSPAAPGRQTQDMKPGEHKAPATTGQAPKNQSTDKNQSMDKSGVNAQTKSKDDATKSGPSTTQTQPSRPSTTTGQGAASGAAKLSTEQRTKITTVIRQQKVERVSPAQLNISIIVGARIPPRVHFYPLPVEVVTIYPEWRGYDYILVGDQILVIEPSTHEIVAILEA